MTIELRCHANCNDVFLAWQVTSPADGEIAGCLGFAIEVKDATGKIEAISNLKGFEQDKPTTGETKPSTEWPLQTYTWTAHSILVGTRVSFRVTAMTGSPGALQRGDSSGWSDWVVLSPQADAGTAAFFNRGMILSQFVARYAKEHNLTTVPELKRNLTSVVGGPLMQFLTGELGKAIRGILQRAQQDTSIELYCALFELDLDDLIEGLIAVGERAHVILANGSVKHAGEDENQAAAARLAGKVDLHRRMKAPEALAHNKFVVVCENGKPTGVWTGSTNWTLTGLHTQVNNGIAVQNAALAAFYFDHWHELAAAGNTFPASLVSGDATVRGPIPLAGADNGSDSGADHGAATGAKQRANLASAPAARVWFTPIKSQKGGSGGPDIANLIDLVNAAQQGILFVMFMPGQEPLDSIIKMQKKGIYVRGVVSTLPLGKQNDRSATFQLLTSSDFKQYSYDIVQPQGVSPVGDFLATFTRQEFLSGMGYAITHSKVIVIDPFGARPVVVTGSHNLSATASRKNDENLLIVENCPELARAYAVNCMSVYAHYRWPAYQHDMATRAAAGKQGSKQAGTAGDWLDTTGAWQARREQASTQADLKFWLEDSGSAQ
ncbi:phospholipase D-like domain-containing protein [Paraburkholderia pallida]|uniref:phospholipase D n=1 Tax=Paraburkholderia pallida TaxID=2547399 RepID=A0A4P7D3I1_9BURK|nr:phospholipase D-like domain-containing protein [Paraburkholderia pallida]QBR02518.1 phosphatidylserine synthase [Paraburkholderia pallida]